jgi:hypothetical protein
MDQSYYERAHRLKDGAGATHRNPRSGADISYASRLGANDHAVHKPKLEFELR